MNIQIIWYWLRENWKIIVPCGITILVLVIGGIIKIIKAMPKIWRIRKVKKYIQGQIDKFNSLTPEKQSPHGLRWSAEITVTQVNVIDLVSDLSETRDIVCEALTKLLRKNIIRKDRDGLYHYDKIVVNK